MKRYMRKKPILIVLLIVVLLVLGAVLRNRNSGDNTSSSSNPLTQQVTIAPSGTVYPNSWTEATQIGLGEKDAGVTSIATKNGQQTKVIVREVPGDLAPNFDIGKLSNQIATQLENQLDGFTLVEKRTLKLGSHSAVKVEYKQLNGADQKIYNYEMFIVPTSRKTYYITYSAVDELSKINDDVTSINKSIVESL